MPLPLQLPIELLVLAFLIVAVSAYIHGALGFGFPLVATPLLTMITDVRSAILLTLLPTVCVNLMSLLSDRDVAAAIRSQWPLAAAAVFGSYLGTHTLLTQDPELFRPLLAILLIAYLLSNRVPAVTPKTIPLWGLLMIGFVAGLLGGLVNIMSPVLIIYALEAGLPTALFVSMLNLSFLFSKSAQIFGFLHISPQSLPGLLYTLVLVPVALLALRYGTRRRQRSGNEQHLRWIRFGLWVIAVILLGQSAYWWWRIT